MRSKPNGRYSIIDGVELAEAYRREGMDGIHSCSVDCTDDQEHEIRRKLREHDAKLN